MVLTQGTARNPFPAPHTHMERSSTGGVFRFATAVQHSVEQVTEGVRTCTMLGCESVVSTASSTAFLNISTSDPLRSWITLTATSEPCELCGAGEHLSLELKLQAASYSMLPLLDMLAAAAILCTVPVALSIAALKVHGNVTTTDILELSSANAGSKNCQRSTGRCTLLSHATWELCWWTTHSKPKTSDGHPTAYQQKPHPPGTWRGSTPRTRPTRSSPQCPPTASRPRGSYPPSPAR